MLNLRIKSLLLALILCGAMITPVYATHLEIEAEDFTLSHDIAFVLIASVAAPSCTGGYLLEGLDATDEWVEYGLTISAFGTWTVAMKGRGDLGVHSFRMTFTGVQSGESQSVTLTFQGTGYG
jgi:hypothetical protein